MFVVLEGAGNHTRRSRDKCVSNIIVNNIHIHKLTSKNLILPSLIATLKFKLIARPIYIKFMQYCIYKNYTCFIDQAKCDGRGKEQVWGRADILQCLVW
jgi:hypothetical protein